jgi:pimeloyl-ACP methyl ester carboxylesterase
MDSDPHPSRTFALPDGRTLAYDDVGDPGGTAVVYFHGTPDSRRSRHPDDAVAAEVGVRLLAFDRPGIGGSTAHPDATVGSIADDVAHLADHLGLDRVRALGWSAGAPFALALAARHPVRVDRVVVAAGLVPFGAYATPGILDDADGGRHLVAELGAELGARATAEMAAPMLAPWPCDLALAREHVAEGAMGDRRTALEAVPGSIDALAAGVVDAVARGLGGLQREVELQVEAPDVAWDQVRAPVDLVYGALDATAPPAFGAWWASVLADATLEVLAEEGHLLALTRWRMLLDLAAR